MDSIVKTPRKLVATGIDFQRIEYEEGAGPIEMPEYTAMKNRIKQEAPVAKTHEKKNFKGIHQNEQVAATLVRSGLKTQSEALKERLQQRKLSMFRKRQSLNLNPSNASNRVNQTVDNGLGSNNRLDSPNMSRSK